jgi:hypothetical protein
MQSGLKRTRKDHRDYDFHKSFGTTPTALPNALNVDAGLWVPDQNAMALPNGCTGFTQADLCSDEDGVIRDPADVYFNTPPFDSGPRNIRDSLNVIRTRGVVTYLSRAVPGDQRTAYYNVRASPPLDWFDAIRLAIYSTQNEKRSVSIGTPWYPEFEQPLQGGILPTPTNWSTSRATWHNWKICGWKTIGGAPYLIGKSWQGNTYANGGFCYVSRDLINRLMQIPGTAAFTVTKLQPTSIQTVDLGMVATIVSFIRQLLGV